MSASRRSLIRLYWVAAQVAGALLYTSEVFADYQCQNQNGFHSIVEKYVKLELTTLETLANNNDADATIAIAYVLLSANKYKDRKNEGFAWMERAALEGCTFAFGEIAERYFLGIDTPRDFFAARRYFHRAENFDPEWNSELGETYMPGTTDDPNIYEAIKWFSTELALKTPVANLRLCTIYVGSYEIPENYEWALPFCRNAAESGILEAQYALGHAYDFGKGTKPDKELARQWYKKASEQGLLIAKIMLMRLDSKDGTVQLTEPDDITRFFRELPLDELSNDEHKRETPPIR